MAESASSTTLDAVPPNERRPHARSMESSSVRSRPRRGHFSLSVQRRAELGLFALLVALYSGAVAGLDPGFAQRPYAVVTHLLLLLAAAAVFLGTWDWLGLASLRHLLRRDRGRLWRRYGRVEALERRLAEGHGAEDATLGGGLVAAVLERRATLGRSVKKFFASHLAEVGRATRIGATSLAYIEDAAPLLGLLGTVLGLRSTFQNSSLAETGSIQIDRVLPYLGVALVTTMLGLAIALSVRGLVHLLQGSVVRDCEALLAPVRAAAESLAERGEEDAAHEVPPSAAWLASPWSAELGRYRILGATLSWILTAELLLAVTLPGGSVDRLLTLGPAPDEPAAESSATVRDLRTRPQDPPADPPAPPPQASERHFEMALGDLLERYDQAVEPEEHRQQVFAHLRYLVPRGEDDELGEAPEARTFAPDKVALAGFQDVVDPAQERWRLDRAFPRVVARLDCQLRDGRLSAVPSVTYAVLDGLGAPQVENADFLRFTDFLAAEEFSSASGQVLDRRAIEALLPAGTIRTFVDRAALGWRSASEVGPGEKPVVLWLAYTSRRKLEAVCEKFEALEVSGRFGDVLVFHWGVDRAAPRRPELKRVELLSPPRAAELVRSAGEQ